MKTLITFVLTLYQVLSFAQQHQNDPHFPARRKFNAGVLFTYSPVTPPPALIADVTYRLTDKLAAGLVGGTTGALGLYGIKINARLYEAKQFRGVFRMLSVYYPERNGVFLFDRKNKYVMPWMLSMAVLDAEWKSKNNIRYSLGAGALETHCIDDMKMWFNPHHDHHAMKDDGEMGEEKLIDIFLTLQAGVSMPLAKRFTARLESFAVFNDRGLIKRERFKVTFPVNTYVSVICHF